MKTILTVLLIFITLNLHAQCPIPVCANVYNLPLSTNDWNNGQGIYTGSNRCVQGPGVFENNQNMPNNWQWISFNGLGSGITINQTINLNTGKRLYLSGTNTLSSYSMSGGADSAIIYCEANSHTTASLPQNPNNSTNYVMLGSGATWYMNGTYWNIGDVYQGPGNNTNVVKFVACGGTALAVEEFKYKNGLLIWDLKRMALVSLQISQDGKNFETIESFLPQVYKYYVANTGYYRITCDGYVSNIISILTQEDLSPPVKRVLLYKVNGLNATKIIK